LNKVVFVSVSRQFAGREAEAIVGNAVHGAPRIAAAAAAACFLLASRRSPPALLRGQEEFFNAEQ
jgi:hypothetical protein